jgi:cyclopropane fatty-acyl-phospholipid synthase-like methyltransferase
MNNFELYRDSGLKIYEKVHYSKGEQIQETEMILSWFRRDGSRILDIGCSGGLHSIELAKRGYQLTGIDREASAVKLARERCRRLRLNAKFFTVDLEKDDLSPLGRFDLVISIGNVMSHIPKKSLPVIFKRIRKCMKNDGIFLFDFIVAGDPFPEEVSEEELGIIWKRKLERSSGAISLNGFFSEFDITTKFDLWGFTAEEISGMILEAGFAGADFSSRLDFSETEYTTPNIVSLKCRARS